MFGEHEAMYHQQMAFERASVLVPGIQAEIVKNAGHLLSLEQPEYVNQRVLSFYAGDKIVRNMKRLAFIFQKVTNVV